MIVVRKRGSQGSPGDAPPAGLIWLATNSCSAHIISFLNSARPSARELLGKHFQFYYDSFIMAAEGERATRFWEDPRLEEGGFILVVEGTVSTAFGGRSTLVGQVNGRDVTALEMVKKLGSRARYVVAAGTCSAYGGPYAAWPNPTGSRPVSEVLRRPVINVPGCPVNPGWIAETLVHLKERGVPRLDGLGRPLFLFGTTVHSLCERLPFYAESRFAENPGDEGCMYLLGCKGPKTRADCPERRWIEERSGWPVGVNTPCIGCTAPEFPDGMAPFFKHTPDLITRLGRVNLEKIATTAGSLAALGIASHLAGKLLTGRIKLNFPGSSPGAKAWAGLLGRLRNLK